jgi:hypothetical protein
MKYLFEVHFHIPGVSGAIGERLLAFSAVDAMNAVRARWPNASIDRVIRLDQ